MTHNPFHSDLIGIKIDPRSKLPDKGSDIIADYYITSESNFKEGITEDQMKVLAVYPDGQVCFTKIISITDIRKDLSNPTMFHLSTLKGKRERSLIVIPDSKN